MTRYHIRNDKISCHFLRYFLSCVLNPNTISASGSALLCRVLYCERWRKTLLFKSLATGSHHVQTELPEATIQDPLWETATDLYLSATWIPRPVNQASMQVIFNQSWMWLHSFPYTWDGGRPPVCIVCSSWSHLTFPYYHFPISLL